MYTRILVPLDGSPRAEAALPVAARLARRARGTLVLTRIVNVNPELSPYYTVPVGTAPQLTFDALAEAKGYLMRVRESEALREIPLETEVFVGITAPGLIQAIESTKADLVVMCSHGRTGFVRWALGSVAQHVARHASVPVLILRDGHPLLAAGQADPGRPLRALVSLDGSHLAEEVLPHVMTILSELAGEAGAELHLASVVNPYEANLPSGSTDTVEHAAKRYLDDVAQRLSTTGSQSNVRITPIVTVNRDIAGYLIGAAESAMPEAEDTVSAQALPYDLMAMATHGRSGVALWAVGSVTERVLQSTHLPLLIVRPKELPREKAAQPAAMFGNATELKHEIDSWPGLL